MRARLRLCGIRGLFGLAACLIGVGCSAPSPGIRQPVAEPWSESDAIAPPAAPAVDCFAPPDTVYRVQRGDTLFAIARRFETTVGILERLNPGVDPARLAVGASLIVPGGKPVIRNVQARTRAVGAAGGVPRHESRGQRAGRQ